MIKLYRCDTCGKVFRNEVITEGRKSFCSIECKERCSIVEKVRLDLEGVRYRFDNIWEPRSAILDEFATLYSYIDDFLDSYQILVEKYGLAQDEGKETNFYEIPIIKEKREEFFWEEGTLTNCKGLSDLFIFLQKRLNYDGYSFYRLLSHGKIEEVFDLLGLSKEKLK